MIPSCWLRGRLQACSLRTASGEGFPTLISFSMLTKVGSLCLHTRSSTTFAKFKLFHAAESKTKFWEPSAGGSWKKSPTAITCTPPIGSFCNSGLPLTSVPRHLLAMKSRVSKRSGETIEISSISRTWTLRHLSLFDLCLYTFSAIDSLLSLWMGMLEKLWMVWPWMWSAAIPVLAQI